MIGVFDSGFGGLTVLKELLRILPYEHFLYLGDTARLPYGAKSPDTIFRYTHQNCSFLYQQGVKCIVIACNTASSLALPLLESHFPIPIIGVIDPVVTTLSPCSHVAILGTRATIASKAHEKKISHLFPKVQITSIPSPLLVSLVEEGWIDHPTTYLAVQEYLPSSLLGQVDALLLACTHFPLLRSVIEEIVGPAIQIIDPAPACAKETLAVLDKFNLASQRAQQKEPLFCVTDDPERFQELGPRFLGRSIAHVEKIELGKSPQQKLSETVLSPSAS